MLFRSPSRRSPRLLPARRPGCIYQYADGALAVEGAEGAEVMEAEAEGVAVDKLTGGNCGGEAKRVVQQLVPYTGDWRGFDASRP